MSDDPRGGSDLRRILLVGFMGAGKTSVGRALATALGWRFVDFDDVIVADAGRPVPEIFRTMGEHAFRELEEQVGRRLLGEERVVLATGGGWAAAPGRLDEVPRGTETFWLRVSPSEALRRAAREPGSRPLLAGNDALAAAERLLSEREARYARAVFAVDTDGRSVEDVTTEVLEILGGKYPEVPRTEVE